MLLKRNNDSEHKSRLHWSLLTSFWFGIVVVLISSGIVLCLLKQPLWLELEYAAAINGLFLFLLYWKLLYSGVRIDENETVDVKWFRRTFVDGLGWQKLERVDDEIGDLGRGGDFLMEVLLEFFPGVLLAFGLGVLLWLLLFLGLEAIYISIVALVVPLFYVFRRSVTFVVEGAEHCAGDLFGSFTRALVYAGVKMMLIFLIIYSAHHIANWLRDWA